MVPDSKPTFEMKPKDIRMDPLVAVQRPYCAPVHLESEDPLFILYTSGSTGRPKGLLHSTGGYSLFAKVTSQTTFDLQEGDLFACVAYVQQDVSDCFFLFFIMACCVPHMCMLRPRMIYFLAFTVTSDGLRVTPTWSTVLY